MFLVYKDFIIGVMLFYSCCLFIVVAGVVNGGFFPSFPFVVCFCSTSKGIPIYVGLPVKVYPL